MPELVLTYQKKSSSQSKPLILMLNGDYGAQIVGSGINVGEMEGQYPGSIVAAVQPAGSLSAVARVTWTSR